MSEQIADENRKRKRKQTDWAALQTPSAKFGRIPTVAARYGLSRSIVYERIASGDIKSAVIKKKGARTGVRIIDMQSVENFLRANTV